MSETLPEGRVAQPSELSNEGPAPDGPRDEGRRGPRAVQYKGAPLDAERGPGLGCFRFQVALLAVAIVLTPLSVIWRWPPVASAALLLLVIVLLFLTGMTMMFLLRLVAAERRAGRRRPLASTTRTVGELEDARREAQAGEPAPSALASDADEPLLPAPASDGGQVNRPDERA